MSAASDREDLVRLRALYAKAHQLLQAGVRERLRLQERIRDLEAENLQLKAKAS